MDEVLVVFQEVSSPSSTPRKRGEGHRTSRDNWKDLLIYWDPMGCLMRDLSMARWEARWYVEYLESADKSVIIEYPRTERLTLEGGQGFFDS